MDINLLNAGLFSLAAVTLLGSPGPGIAALVAIGRDRGFREGLRFYWGLQGGLALAAAISAAGLSWVMQTIPLAATALKFIAAAYLIWLAYKIATAPVAAASGQIVGGFACTARGGFLLGITNPKAYIAFASLMASYAIVQANAPADGALKWLLCVMVIVVVDIVWLSLGVVVGRADLKPAARRALNIVMGGTIIATALLSIV